MWQRSLRQTAHFAQHISACKCIFRHKEYAGVNLKNWDLSKFFDRSLDLLAIASKDGYFLKLNPMWSHLLGYTEAELTTRPFIYFVHPDDVEKTQEVMKYLSKDGQKITNYTNRYRCKDGSLKQLMWSAWTEDGVFWAAARDITRLIEIEEETKTHKQLFEQIANNVPGMVYQFKMTPNGEVGFTYVSKGAHEIFDQDLNSRGKTFDTFFNEIQTEDAEKLKAAILTSAKELSEFHWVGRVKTAKNNERWFEARSTPEKLKDGAFIWNGILFDITKSIEAQKQLELARAETVHASKLSALGEMAAGIAHEINNPLAIIHGYADRILRFSENSKLNMTEARRLAEKILQGTARIEKTVKSLAKLSYRKTDDVYERRCISDIINDALNVSNEKFHSSGVNVQVSKSASEIVIECVPIEISQAILNLLNNSFDAIESMDTKWIHIDITDLDPNVEIAIIDSGPGIPIEILDRLWEPFYTSKEVGKGTGLGLAISRRLIEKHDGRLYVDTHSKNTRFVIELPKISKNKFNKESQ